MRNPNAKFDDCYLDYNDERRLFAPEMPVGWPRPSSLDAHKKKRDAEFVDVIAEALAVLMITLYEHDPTLVRRVLRKMNPRAAAKRQELVKIFERARRKR